MFFTDNALEVAQRGIKWIPDPAVIEEQQIFAARRRAELTNHGVPCEPPCNECAHRKYCQIECAKFREYSNAPLSHRKRLDGSDNE